MADLDPLAVLQPAADKVRDPLSDLTVWQAGMVRNAALHDNTLSFELWFSPRHSRSDRRSIEEAVVSNVMSGPFDGRVTAIARLDKATPSSEPGLTQVDPSRAKPPAPAPPKKTVPGMEGGGMAPHGGPIVKQRLEGVKHIVCVASGKGGVGKSTVSVNLAVALQQLGLSVGLLDADIYGPSLPTMLNVDSRPLADSDQKILPVVAYGVRCLSIGMLVPPHEAIIWRGPMVMGALRQFLQDTRWGDLDVLVVDLPPGTGDAQLSLIQSVDISGAVIVTTPQKVALDDAVRGIAMFHKLEVPLLGVVENMAWYELPDGTRDLVFGEGGGVAVAAKNGTKVLAQIPLQTQLRVSADEGQPAALIDNPTGRAFAAMARSVAADLGLSLGAS